MSDHLKIAQSIAEAIAYKEPVVLTGPEDTTFDVTARFLSQYVPEIYAEENDAYLMQVLIESEELDADTFRKDPYLQRVSFKTHHKGEILLSNMSYKAGEILQYDFPLLKNGEIIPRIGYFGKKVSFPTIFEENVPWMSVIPSEINTMKEPVRRAHGHLLVLGLGLGYYAYMTARKENVQDLNIIEKNPEIISLFKKEIFPKFEEQVQKKIRITESDAFAYMDTVRRGQYDFVFTDIYEGYGDGHPVYEKMQQYEEKLPDTEFAYWIEDYIR